MIKVIFIAKIIDLNEEYKYQENSSINQIAFMTDTKVRFSKATLDFTYFGQLLELILLLMHL